MRTTIGPAEPHPRDRRLNTTQRDFIAADILARQPRVVGIHRLIMKAGSDNQDLVGPGVMKRLKAKGVEVIVHEPTLDADRFFNFEVVNDLEEFKRRADLIVTNRQSPALADVAAKGPHARPLRHRLMEKGRRSR